ncbi:adhesion G-protein coupled receptor V1-like [Saccostrea echinata]|uniref:adhesion G-protein coupled receptor V1-like n=1 Tax=Saccostrea echinata TaxID=191078 RepID=UPI002A80C529|nr:adhesion G-protein coupled receptor V1-like [Saccostrea echinata]
MNWVFLLWSLLPLAVGQLFVSLLDTAVMVNEGDQFELRVQKSGPITQVIIVAVSCPNDTSNDFVGSSQVGSFYPGGPDIISVTFTVNDDSDPETEETFIFELTVISVGITVGTQRVAAVTIAANDDAYGVFSFLDTSPVLVTEDTITSVVSLRVGREKGTFGQVTVTYLVNSSDSAAVPGVDITPRTGVILFQGGDTQTYLQLQIRADSIPENNEEFRVTMTSATQGARVTDTELILIIQANDAPIRFQQSEYRFDEGPGDKSVSIQVLRGIDEDGQSRIGSVNNIASVDYFLVSDTATSGLDFRGTNGQVVFFAGETTGNILLEILDDGDPEMEESFGIVLSGPKGDAITTYPTKINIRINANDNPNGVLSFVSTNGVSLPKVKVSEDMGTVAVFPIQRKAGTFGTVSVTWQIFRNDSTLGDVKSDITLTSGMIVFQAGQTEQKLNISVVNDNIPEPTERYIIRLMVGTETGGARVEGIMEGVLLVEDSDNYYGSVYLGPDSEHRIVVSSNPRYLQVNVQRSNNNQGDLTVNLTVSYTGSGSVSDVLETTSKQADLFSGQSSLMVKFYLLSSAFLHVGDTFTVILTGFKLKTDPDFGAYNSPTLGSKVSASVPVTLTVANGEIGFQSIQPITVNEPAITPYTVALKLTREGTSGRAYIDWSLKGSGVNAAMVTTSDTGITSGTAIMEAGSSATLLLITIMPDNIPELEEEITVTLTSVSPSDTQRLKVGSTQTTIIILENDNPGGIFQFSSTMKTSYLVQEGLSAIEVVVERSGGNLITQYVQYQVLPGGNSEFYGATNVLKFDSGVQYRNSTLLAIADGVPELNEKFTLTLLPYGNSSGIIGNFSSIEIEVEENDDPYGLIKFQLNPAIYYLNESSNGEVVSLIIPVERSKGRFGSIIVKWDMTPGTGEDLTPVSGTITFGSQQDKGFIHLESVADIVSQDLQVQTINDNIPEPDENFTISLSIYSGKARVGSPDQALVVIKENDHRLYFRGRVRRAAVLSGTRFLFEGKMYTKEPGIVKLKIKREGPGTERAAIRYQTVDSSATASSGDYIQITAHELVFEVGEMEREISVEVLNDDIPEGNETFYVQIFDIQGDLVLGESPNASITILANDNAYGVFRFNPPLQRSTEEGSDVQLNILRSAGLFGVVDIGWEIREALTNRLMYDGGEFIKANGTVRFKQNEVNQFLVVTPRIDYTPEENKDFKVLLTYTTIIDGIPDSSLASIANTSNEVRLTVVASDDPYGKFAFTTETKSLTVAEDFYPGQESSTKATFTVERRQGIFGNVEVLWEVYSSNTGSNLPLVYDLILVANIPSKVDKQPSKRRPKTGTDVIHLTGTEDNYLTVLPQYQPKPSELESGFSISAWVQPVTTGSYYIVAKTTNDGIRLFYTLKLVAGVENILIFGYSQLGESTNKEISITTNQKLMDRNWHHILVTIASGDVRFYLDGHLLGLKSIGSQPLIDTDGVLLVGAKAPNTERFIGYLQDVRIYTAALQDSQRNEIYQTPAQFDVTPISGYLIYLEGNREKNLTLTSLQDQEEENDEVFTVRLLGAKNGGTISQKDNIATLTILKSDNANGVFSFHGDCAPTHSTQENEVVTCTVIRNRGDDGAVNVTWSVFQSGTAIEATADFINSSGIVSFEAGERTKVFTVTVNDDDIPEVQETFDIKLTSALTGSSGSTNTSGASIDLSASTFRFTILKSDHSNGLLQFTNSSMPPQGTGIIPPATEKPVVYFPEESGLITVIVERAQGTKGQVEVEWRTSDLTAKSSGKTPIDYQGNAGRLSFIDGERYKTINIVIVDNSIPEDQKTFRIDLFNPQGGADVGVGSSVTVVITHSDGAYGVFEFDEDSLNVQALERGDSGYTSTGFKVIRKQGRIGNVSVKWLLTGNPGNDVVQTEGTVTFDRGVEEAVLYVNVKGDPVPELDKTYQLVLTDAAPGSTGLRSTSNFTILANDNPYGVFQISENFRPLQVDEQYKNVSITISRKYGTYGEVEVFYRTLLPNETNLPYLPSVLARADRSDFRHVEGSLIFTQGQSSASFNVLVMDDNLPETDESVFVTLSRVQLLKQAQSRTLTDSPTLGTAAWVFGQIIIRSNDNAHGTLILSPLSVSVPENATDVGVSVQRQGGAFGEVSVKFRVANNTALQGLDFEVLTDTVLLPEGVVSRPLPIRLIDDLIPEQQEVFYVELENQITGGAVLGSASYAVVTILPSDDPNGLFEFEVSGLSVEEPENGSPVTVTVNVVRKGGTMNVVTVLWSASLNNVSPSEDINPTSGALYFVSNEAQRQIPITILPDDIPEGKEDIVLTLVSANNGSIGPNRNFILSIQPNDNPHGTVQFSTNSYNVTEQNTNSVQYLSLSRSGGVYGQLRVFYSTLQLLIDSDTDPLTYFDPPINGSRRTTGQIFDTGATTNPLKICAENCLKMSSCVAFEFSSIDNISLCMWFTTTTTQTISTMNGYQYYSKNIVKVQELQNKAATAAQDFSVVSNGYIMINDGATSGQLPVSILADDIPELDEVFLVKLTQIEVASSGASVKYPPQLGQTNQARVTINKNDNAYGKFRLVSQSPQASDGGTAVGVEEKPQLAVDLIVERLGGNLGHVSVEWFVNTNLSTAEYNKDFLADGATLKFTPGQTQSLITVTVLDDNLPEENKTVIVQLRNPQGGAEIEVGSGVTVTIMENDNVAGVLGFERTSFLAEEGEKVMIQVLRTKSTRGSVSVDWEIVGLRGILPQEGFTNYNGTLMFRPTEVSKIISLDVKSDEKPEVNEEYQINLVNIITYGIGPSGAAIVNPLLQTASITIKGSNDPHGVIQFSQNSLSIRTEEINGKVDLQVDRKFGAIGTVRVSYSISQGSVTPLSEELSAATPTEDFTAVQGYVDIPDQNVSVTISAQIVDDAQPEVDEVFIVSLTGVTLMNSTDTSSMPPRLGNKGTVSQIIINANDGTKGVVKFGSDSNNVNVDEIRKNISLSVIRTQGTFGNVSVFYYARSIVEGTTQGLDYTITPQEIFFAKGENQKYIMLEILNDDIPEPDETFQVILSQPREGVEIGEPSRANVTILANDEFSGTVTFKSHEIVRIEESPGENMTLNVARLEVMRGPGIYGSVNVPFRVIPERADNSADITPTEGVITFQDRQGTVFLELTALDDDLPEHDEIFTVHLLAPDNSAKLGVQIQKTVIITANDSPSGLLQINVRHTMNNTISVEENIGQIFFDVTRSQGSDGMVTVDLATQPDTAVINTDPKHVTLSPLETMITSQVTGWHSFYSNDTLYLVMLTSYQAGELTSGIGSAGNDSLFSVDRFLYSTLFRWQGQMVPVQTIETDVAMAATTFSIGLSTFLVICNFGNVRRYETKSRLYRVNHDSSLLVLQEFLTKGASDVEYFNSGSDHFLVLTNSRDNNGETLMNVDVYKWDNTTRLFTPSPWQRLENQGASAVAVLKIEGVVYMAIANNYNSKLKSYTIHSVVYKFGNNQKFSEHQRIETHGATDANFLQIHSLTLLVFASNRGDIVSSPQTSNVYRWDSTAQTFFRHTDIQTSRVNKISPFFGTDQTGYLAVANTIGNSAIYAWDIQNQRFDSVWSGPPATQLYPVIVTQSAGSFVLMPMVDVDPKANCTIFHLIKVTNSDFSPRLITLTFEPGQRLISTSVEILEDYLPENTETFFVTLTNPTGGATIGPKNKITVNILSNDNAHGIIEFAEDSRELTVEELDHKDSVIQLNVVRQQGFFGRVVVSWSASGDQSGLSDITPLSGQVEFANGQSVATISLTILNDNLAELPEVTFIRLIKVTESGSTLDGKGAQLGSNNVAKVIVQANDSPYGVVLWEKQSLTVEEPEGSDQSQTLYIIREQGMMGDLQVLYQTAPDFGVSVDNQAISGLDFVSQKAIAVLQENVTKVAVTVVIKQDDFPEAEESFLLNITEVKVMGIIPPPGAEPSVKVPGNILRVSITENDGIRGIVQFNVTTNIEGRIDTYEEYGQNTTVKLRVSRSVGFLGDVTLTWQAEPREASILDFWPSSGTVNLKNEEAHTDIIMYILDDTINEPMETFDVKLLSISSGLSQLGTMTVVRIAILKNDSPTGLFRFSQSEVRVRESLSPSDPGGEATLTVERIQGSDGVVNVQWRLNAEAFNDFQEPRAGTLQFAQGEKTKTITLRTKQDSTLEGEERFRVSLISADNSADISPTLGDSTIIVEADPGARGTISILPEYRTVYIGEPGESSPSYDGQVKVMITRGLGIYGSVSVTWSLIPRATTAFHQVEGIVNMADLQQTTFITLQAIDDTVPEKRTTYTLHLTSATGGATVSPDPSAIMASVVFVASDYPHGRFQFTLPQLTAITEDISQVTISVIRTEGTDNQVLVSYTTTQGSAQSYTDFYPATNTLTFQQGQSIQTIDIRIIQDDLPEGPEEFFVNLTSARLVNPGRNNYTEVNGLQRDMKPGLGLVDVKTILIDKNDNAEGTVQFDVKGGNLRVSEESGVAQIRLKREGGNYGDIEITYSVHNITAQQEVDYVVSGNKVTMSNGSRNTTIDITIRDDSDMEFEETFEVQLLSVSGGARLGNPNKTLVTILKSDFPNGNFGFKSPLKFRFPNPERLIQQTVTIERKGGLEGQQTVYWRIMGPNNPLQVLEATNDISMVSENHEVTSGSLVWSSGENAAKSFVLDLKPFSSWEVEKTFVVEIYSVQGSPPGTGNGEISTSAGKITIIIDKFGHPNGIVRFEGQAQSVRTVEEPEGIAPLELMFPISRRFGTGTTGSIQIKWTIEGSYDEKAPDFQPQNGTLLMADGQRDSSIVIQVLPDTIPELTETFSLALQSTVGGAEIDTQFNSSLFKILYNDYPHGLFGVQQSLQSLYVNPVDLNRFVKLNITRYYGTFGAVIVTFIIKYDQPLTGVILSRSSGTVEFTEGTSMMTQDVLIGGDGFLEMDTTFTITLTQVQFLGAGVTDPPNFKAGETETKVKVPALAANSEVGFTDNLGSIDEESGTATLILTRRGLYGTIHVPWRSGFPSGGKPEFFTEGQITPPSGSLTMPHGIQTKNFTISVVAVLNRTELFALHLTNAPSTTARGGARLSTGSNVIKLEPHGVIRFAPNSTHPQSVSEMEKTISLMVQRLYGSEGKIEITYRSVGVSAQRGIDFVTTETNAIVLDPGVTSGLITIQVRQDNIPEEEEMFTVNLTHVEKYPTEIVPKISPRLSFVASSSVVRIKESNDAYGVLNLEPSLVVIDEENRRVNFTIQRTGGLYGTISVLVRTVGGGEPWTSQIVPEPNPTSNDTITQILGARDGINAATAVRDYEILDTRVEFKQDERVKSVSVEILSDTLPEPDETVIVYLAQPTGDARIAKGAPDGGKKGFSVITIKQNDLSNGIIGFAQSSKVITVNEDTSPAFSLTLFRSDAKYGDVVVSWKTKLSVSSTEAQDAVLGSQLQLTAGTTICPALEDTCQLNITLLNDEKPEEADEFIVILTDVRNDARLDEQNVVARVLVEASDHVRGLIQFSKESQIMVIGKSERNVRLKVERLKGRGYRVQVGYQTLQMTNQESLYGIRISPALENEDYQSNVGTLVFEENRQELQYIDISMTPVTASSNPLPKQFFVQLKTPTGGASLHPETSYNRAIIRIVEDSTKSIWETVMDSGSLNNDTNLLRVLSKLDEIAKKPVDQTEIILVENTLRNMIEEGLRRRLTSQVLNQLLNVLCSLMNPNKGDATRGRHSLADLMENLAYASLTEAQCPSPTPPEISSLQCIYAKMSAARWPLQQILNYKYSAQRQDTFIVPSSIPNPPTPVGSDCLDMHVIEYNSEQWFMKSDERELLSNKVIAFGIKGKSSTYSEIPARFLIHTPDRRIAARTAQCVYFDTSVKEWVSPRGVCSVNNNLEDGQDDFVDCSCKHLTHYAVKASAIDPGLAGYPTAFYVVTFICMLAMLLAIIVHHVFSTIYAMFSASLLMHMLFACFATQLCYIVAAFTSPTEILVSTLDQDNYRCIVMGLFLHYFFLAQFTWIFSQTLNFWKILVMNDEHTDRKYVLFFMLGWGLPLAIVAVFYVVTFIVYKYQYGMPVDFIYGDVNNNGQMCFLTNSYAALGGVIAPVLLILLFVAVVFVKAFQVTPQWQAYDDIYRGRYNINEIRTLLCFWFVITITWLWGGLHMAYGQLWMLVMFCIFNIVQALLVIVLYTILRNPCVQECLGPQKRAYSMSTENLQQNGSLPADFHHHTFTTEIGSLKGSTASVVNEEWERDSTLPSKSTTMKVKRTLPSSGNIYVTPPVLVRDGVDDFQDLLHALKTQESSSDADSLGSDKISEISSKVDRYEMRRISIADTHL